MIQNLTFGILFLKTLFRAYRFFIFVHTVQWTLSKLFLISDFLTVSKPTKTSEKDNSFYNTVSLKKPHSFYWSQLTWHWQQIAPATAKTLSDFTNFPANMFLFGVRNNICTASFLDGQEPHSWNTLKVNACIYLYISVIKFLFQRHSKISSGEGWVGAGWKISLRRLLLSTPSPFPNGVLAEWSL